MDIKMIRIVHVMDIKMIRRIPVAIDDVITAGKRTPFRWRSPFTSCFILGFRIDRTCLPIRNRINEAILEVMPQ